MGDSRMNEATVTFCAAAGLGLQTAEDLCRQQLAAAGFYVFSSREYMSRVRGGNNSTQLRVSRHPVRAAVDRIDWLFALSPDLRANITESISGTTKILGDKDVVGSEINALGMSLVDLGLAERAQKLGSPFYSSMIVAGFVSGLFGLSDASADTDIEARFVDELIAEKNKLAFREGHRLGVEQSGGNPILSAPEKPREDKVFMDGHSAVALGAAAAGCNYITAYPMSPGTGVFSFFAKHAHELACVVEQTEDELAAVNMAIGASYAGARAMATTSGGGFVLMTEGISLAGITETPLVVHLAQRPGPATGLATRTEQADLEIALHAGHGEFPKVLYAPINIESAFLTTVTAFQTAGKFQTQSIVLTDQYLLDSGYDVEKPDLFSVLPPIPPVEAKKEYLRYAFATNDEIVSPFAVPGYGSGFVSFDSHEHTESARITEDRAIRKKMVEKRLRKGEAMQREAIPPIVVGPEAYHTLVICWGSTFEPLREAMEILNRDGVALAACEQVFPLSDAMMALMETRTLKIFVEGNATGQFARLVRSYTGTIAEKLILKYDGFPFTVDELVSRLGDALGKTGTKEAM